MRIVLEKILYMKIILPIVNIECNCNHAVKKNMFFIIATEIDHAISGIHDFL